MCLAVGIKIASIFGNVGMVVSLRASISIAKQIMKAFFFGTDDDIRHYRDPLMDTIMENPLNSLSFIK